jgi:hypothetical protein
MEIPHIVRQVIDDVQSNPVDTSATASVIPYESSLAKVIGDVNMTAYVPESQFRVLHACDTQYLLATTGILNCIAVFASLPGGSALCAHISPSSLEYSLDEIKFLRRGGLLFENMVDCLKRTFAGVNNADITINIVGGWRLADTYPKLEEIYYRKHPDKWTFSSVVLGCMKDALPGAKIDVSQLNRFDGVSWVDRTVFSKMKRVAIGEAFRIVVLNTRTGMIDVQTTDITDLTGEQSVGVSIPECILNESVGHLSEMNRRIDKFRNKLFEDEIPPPVLHEFVVPIKTK